MNLSKHKMNVLSKICKLILWNLVPKLASEYNSIDRRCHDFNLTALMYLQLLHAISQTYHDSCWDTGIAVWGGLSCNGLSHANQKRNVDMAEALLLAMLEHLQAIHPGFGLWRRCCGFPRLFKRTINVVDSSMTQLFANGQACENRRRKAAAKMPLRLNLQSFLPRYIIVKAADIKIATASRIMRRHSAGRNSDFR